MLERNRELRQASIISIKLYYICLIHYHLTANKALPIIGRRAIWTDYNTAQERTRCQENPLVRVPLERWGLGANWPSDRYSFSKFSPNFWERHTDSYLLQDTNSILHTFSSENYTSIYRAIIAFESLRTAWEEKIKLEKYASYHEALNDGLENLRKYYYNKFDVKPAFLLSLGKFSLCRRLVYI